MGEQEELPLPVDLREQEALEKHLCHNLQESKSQKPMQLYVLMSSLCPFTSLDTVIIHHNTTFG